MTSSSADPFTEASKELIDPGHGCLLQLHVAGKLGISSCTPNAQPIVPLARVGKIHRNDSNVLALHIRCNLGMENNAPGLAPRQEDWASTCPPRTLR